MYVCHTKLYQTTSEDFRNIVHTFMTLNTLKIVSSIFTLLILRKKEIHTGLEIHEGV